MQLLNKEHLVIRIAALIENLRQYETIEIKQKDYIPGQISVTVKSTQKEEFDLNEKNNEL